MNRKIIAGAIIVLAGTIVFSVGVFFLSFTHPHLAMFTGISMGLVILASGLAVCVSDIASALGKRYTPVLLEQIDILKKEAADPRQRGPEDSEPPEEPQ